MKTLAFYLPQFHQIIENDEWWGEGYTEWHAVREAKPMFEGHTQPKEPLEGRYYDLQEKDTMAWQAQLLKRGGLSGLCFYHYWFNDGKKILEKPAENLLKWTDIEMPFCFYWANETWARSWSAVSDAVIWREKEGDDLSKNGILLEQKYGIKDSWKKHFDYLLPFFNDERYIHVEGKPMLIILKPSHIPSIELRISQMKKWAEESGLGGLYVIGRMENENLVYSSTAIDAYISHEPKDSFENLIPYTDAFKNKQIKTCSYDDIWEPIIAKSYDNVKKTYLSGFTNYDDSPRRAEPGIIIGSTPEKFKYYFRQLVMKSLYLGNDFIFINAWNEWGEGMYLEPDKENGFAYLDAVAEVMDEFGQDNYLCERKFEANALEDNKTEIRLKKFKRILIVLDNWLTLKEKGITLDSYLTKKDYKSIAIYGMGILGRYLLTELVGSTIDVKYAIDKSITHSSSIPIICLEDEWPEVDAIILTPVMEVVGIANLILNKVDYPLIGIDELIFECL